MLLQGESRKPNPEACVLASCASGGRPFILTSVCRVNLTPGPSPQERGSLDLRFAEPRGLPRIAGLRVGLIRKHIITLNCSRPILQVMEMGACGLGLCFFCGYP
jgi:hypothetical protein